MAANQTNTGALGLPQGINVNLVNVPIWDLEYAKSSIAEETRHGHIILGGIEPGKVFPIGRLQDIDFNAGVFERTVTPVREVAVPETEGSVVAQIPGDMGDPSITLSRIELYNGRFETALGLGEAFVTIMDQIFPFFLVERKTIGPSKRIFEEILYNGCIFTALGKSGTSIGGEKTILASATISYVNKVRVKIAW